MVIFSSSPGLHSEILKPGNRRDSGGIFRGGYEIRPEIFGEEVSRGGTHYFHGNEDEESIEIWDTK